MALEPINCTTYSREIEQEYLKVVRGDDYETTWLIISPDAKKEYKPEFVGSDFSEFLTSFEDSKVQYGLARVSPPGSDVKKLILVGWCPDSAPMKSKASFAANFGTVANQVLKGYHVQVTARDEDDLNENELLQKISNAAGARYSIQMKQEQQHNSFGSSAQAPALAQNKPKQQPKRKEAEKKPSISAIPATKVVEVPQKSLERQAPDDGDDWDEPELLERDLEQNPLKPNDSSYKPIGKIDLQKVIAEEKAREDPRLVNVTEASQKIEPGADIAKLKEQSKLKRDQEINAFLGTQIPASVSTPQKNDDLTIKGFRNEKSPAQLWAEKKAAATATATTSSTSTPSAGPNKIGASHLDDEVENENEESDVKDLKSKFEKLSSKREPAIITPRRVETKAALEKSVPASVKSDSSRFGQRLPGMHVEVPEDDEVEEDDWDDEEPSDTPALPSRSSYEKISKVEDTTTSTANETEEESVEAAHIDEEPQGEVPATEESATEEPVTEEPAIEEPAAEEQAPSRKAAAPPPPARRSVDPPKAALPSAIAEYDYEAGEDNELTFTENDKIINIDFVDDDWWLGELERTGEKGLFPSNYVSLEN